MLGNMSQHQRLGKVRTEPSSAGFFMTGILRFLPVVMDPGTLQEEVNNIRLSQLGPQKPFLDGGRVKNGVTGHYGLTH